jgi:hypothetical protein
VPPEVSLDVVADATEIAQEDAVRGTGEDVRGGIRRLPDVQAGAGVDDASEGAGLDGDYVISPDSVGRTRFTVYRLLNVEAVNREIREIEDSRTGIVKRPILRRKLGVAENQANLRGFYSKSGIPRTLKHGVGVSGGV